MLERRIRAFVEPRLDPNEGLVVAMAAFRPLSRSAALYVVLPIVLFGLAIAPATGIPAWATAAVAGGVGAGLAAWLDHRRARFEHDGKGLAAGIAASDRRLFVLDLATGPFTASVAGIDHEVPLGRIGAISTERMQGSALKRDGVVLTLEDGDVIRLIPARLEPLLAALG